MSMTRTSLSATLVQPYLTDILIMLHHTSTRVIIAYDGQTGKFDNDKDNSTAEFRTKPCQQSLRPMTQNSESRMIAEYRAVLSRLGLSELGALEYLPIELPLRPLRRVSKYVVQK